jgi:DNA-binding NtrC family response regulator
MNILHLEDDGPLREILAAALRAVEPTCELHQFIKSDDALAYVRQHPQTIDLFIIDIRVPGTMDGLQMAHRVRELSAPGAMVLTSAYRVPDQDVLKKLDCQWYPKPWHIIETSTKLLKLAYGRQPTGSQQEAAASAPGNGNAVPSVPAPSGSAGQAGPIQNASEPEKQPSSASPAPDTSPPVAPEALVPKPDNKNGHS